MEYKIAKTTDIEEVLALHKKYHIDTVSETDKAEGFITTNLDEDLLTELIENEQGLFIAKKNDSVVGYLMSASWAYCSKWPIFQYMITRLGETEYLGQKITTENSYQYGPICIDKEFRGSGVLQGLFDFARKKMQRKYPILVTFVNTKNPRSLKAHIDKLNLENVMGFEFNNNSYIELVYDTSKSLKSFNQ